MRPTPQTDAALNRASQSTDRGDDDLRYAQLGELLPLCRNLERERDEAVELLRACQAMLATSDGYGVRCPSSTQGRTWLLQADAFLARLEKEKSCE